MFISDFIFPKACLNCGYLGSYICLDCRYKLKPVSKESCLYCQSFSPLGLTHISCSKKLSIDGLVSLFYYNEVMKKIIKNIKYRLVTKAFDDLFAVINHQMIEKLMLYKRIFKQCLIQPIPLHKSRFNTRGFNQAQIIADFLGKNFNLPVVNFLERKKPTPSLAGITNKKERYFRIQGAFIVKDKLQVLGKRFILVDDVVTSGATVKEACKALKRSGALNVYVFSLSRG